MKNILCVLCLFIGFKSNAQSDLKYDKVPGIPIAHSPKSTGVFLGTPSVVIMSNGDYIVSCDLFGEPIKRKRVVHVYLSKDKGKTWTFLSKVDSIHWAGLFVVKDNIYLLGREGFSHNMAITRSGDGGKTWENLSIIKEKTGSYGYHGSATPVVFHNGRVYKGYDRHLPDQKGRFMSDNRSFILSASVNDNLMDPKSWVFSNSIKMPDNIDGTGWLETNAVLGRDGKIKGITRIASKEGDHAGYYSLAKDTRIDPASVGQIDFIGGATKFNILWDPRTGKYWSLVNYPSPVVKKLKNRSGGMRSILALTSSKDLKNWDIQSIVLATEDVNFHGFQYVDWQFDGEDIVFVSRTAYDDEYGGAESYHNSNFITFHRIEKYKDSRTPQKFLYLLDGSLSKKIN